MYTTTISGQVGRVSTLPRHELCRIRLEVKFQFIMCLAKRRENLTITPNDLVIEPKKSLEYYDFDKKKTLCTEIRDVHPLFYTHIGMNILDGLR